MTHLTPEAMYSFVDRNPHLVTAKVQSNGLRVLKYKKQVFYKNLWTPELLECRGTVVDVVDDNKLVIVQRPFTKIFNLHERGTRIHRDAIVTAPRKVNGFMAAVTWYDGKPLVSTTGSCDSDYAVLAEQVLSNTQAFDIAQEFSNGMTWVYEIVDPSDPHIVKEEAGAWLLGCRRTQWDASQHCFNEHQLDNIVNDTGIKRPEWFRAPFGNILEMNRRADHEGFVCWTDEGYELKLKSPTYLVTKFLARIRGAKLVKAIESDPEGLKRNIDEEFYPLIDHIVRVKDSFAGLPEQDRIKVIEEFIDMELTK